jgi:membrane protein DedA with SNARE-associated domain
MSIIQQLTDQLTSYANMVPLEIFVFAGAMIEEILAPIPSPIVMTIAGSLAEAQNQTWSYLILLALIGAVGKTLGSYILYLVSDKLEDIVVGKFGKFFGLSHKEIESLGKHFSGGLRDDIIIFLARAIPIVPTAPVSIVCGAIKVRLRTYLVSTFLGTIIRNMFYLYLGYVGLAGYEKVVGQFESIEKIATVTIGLILVGGVAVIWYAKNKDRLVEALQKRTLERHKKDD